ncbi:MAG: C-GCAxxG-C-C family protein [Thermincola sp.]|jgi:C_GCAxxG_C_C family probable redox protein|nr:C-GCAxxG-C-C family protein [Thermincola sp.]MDT3702471.1 C-GCAxxG-C-C family protein [Thermincola sp.]
MGVDSFHLFKLAAQGFCCSQILLILALEAQGKENPDLVRAMEGLCGGLGRAGKTCGALTGGTCLLGLQAGRGLATEPPSRHLNEMVKELVEWFEKEFNSLECADILDGTLDADAAYPVKCGQIVMGVYHKVQEILNANKDNSSIVHEA